MAYTCIELPHSPAPLPPLFPGDLCPVGTYNNLTGLRAANECAPCDPGYYCPNQGIVVPDKLCSAGHYCELGSTEPAPVGQVYGYSCPVGHYCPEGTPAPVPCSAGFYQPGTGRVKNRDGWNALFIILELGDPLAQNQS